MGEALWVYAEHQEDEIGGSSLELICEAKKLADKMQAELSVILLGHGVAVKTESLGRYGVDKAYVSDHTALGSYHPERFTDLLTGLVRDHDPGILLFPATTTTEDLAPRVAARLRTQLIPHCDKLALSDEGQLLLTRLTHQSKVHTTLASPSSRPQMATFEPGIGKVKKKPTSQDIDHIQVDPEAYLPEGSRGIEVTGFIKADPRTIDISEAELIVSGGKGVEDEGHFQLIHDLADAMGASVAGSRVAVDNQWIGRERQIGQSGQTVSPNLMISCGISGANAHTFGMRDTKILVAINKDKAAPIMKMADLGVVGDLKEVLPILIDRLKEARKQSEPED